MGQAYTGRGGAGRNATCHVSTTLMHIFEQEEENTNTIRCDAKSTRAYSDDDELRNSSSTQKEHETHHNESKNLNAKITSKICKKLFLFDETNTHTHSNYSWETV